MKTALRNLGNKVRVFNRSLFEDVMFCAWFGKQSCVGLSYVRRIERNSDKFQQATRHLHDNKRDMLGKLLDKMQILEDRERGKEDLEEELIEEPWPTF